MPEKRMFDGLGAERTNGLNALAGSTAFFNVRQAAQAPLATRKHGAFIPIVGGEEPVEEEVGAVLGVDLGGGRQALVEAVEDGGEQRVPFA